MRMKWVWSGLKNVVTPAVIAAAVSYSMHTGVDFYRDMQIRNEQTRIENLQTDKTKFDSASNKLVIDFSLYANALMDKRLNTNKDNLRQSIITTQISLNSLKTKFADDPDDFVRYGRELDHFNSAVDHVEAWTDLKPAYVSAQRLVMLRENLDKKLTTDMKARLY